MCSHLEKLVTALRLWTVILWQPDLAFSNVCKAEQKLSIGVTGVDSAHLVIVDATRCFSTCLLGKGVLACVQARNPQPAPNTMAWPCPKTNGIAPCVCTENTDDLVLDMYCSNVKSNAELPAAFQP